MRNKIYQIVHIYEGNVFSIVYKYFMILVIAASLLPLTVKEDPVFFTALECVCLVFFIIDYILRWITADYKFRQHSWRAFVKYPIRIISIIDMLSIFALASSVFGWFPDGELTQVLAVFRIIRIFRYSKNVRMILAILKRSKKPLAAVGGLAIGYIIISAIVILPRSASRSFAAKTAGKNSIFWASIKKSPCFLANAYNSFVWASVVVQGFSQMTCLPASSAAFAQG